MEDAAIELLSYVTVRYVGKHTFGQSLAYQSFFSREMILLGFVPLILSLVSIRISVFLTALRL